MASLRSTETHEPHSAPTFRERVYMLVGRSTWREPFAAPSGDAKPIPAEHMVAAALSFGREGRDDIGPDIAFDMATGRAGHRRVVCAWLGRVLASDRSASCVRVRPLAAHYAVWAYNAVVQGWQVPPAPDGVATRDHGEVALFACLLLERAAEDALCMAARRARAA